MAAYGGICSSCKVRRSNPGYKWCVECYNYSKNKLPSIQCKNCGKPPNPGFDLCENCYRKGLEANGPLQISCILCNKSWAEPNADLCRQCLDLFANETGPQLTQQSCNKCTINIATPGFPMCEGCHSREQLQRIYPYYQPYANGYASMQMPYPIPQYTRPAHHQQLPPMTYTQAYPYQNTEVPAAQDKDVKSLLDMGSTHVNTKEKKEKEDRPSSGEASDYHCICPQCYSDTSRIDLFYCVHCFDNVVEGKDICRDCTTEKIK
ncbi:hypothetical protein LOD99_7236 [Oopsacas minuta]|uniref:Uncharacterized protein n=1 Tax=Oopsacas minuta TaxID=111878 RepID=A0AAV7JUG8_9METZ|nr:hypothetical protein LOD99_7236 [Oopsacas minuta]